MADAPRVVAHFINGKLLKGTTQDFNPNRHGFHLIPSNGGPVVEIQYKLLKAVFFVRSLKGNPLRQDFQGFIAAPAATSHGKKLAVRFKDGELLCGYTLAHRPDHEGFFLFPADPGSNNLRVYVLAAQAVETKAGTGAEAMARKALTRAGV
ncbi:MAG: hypothetical protein DMH00_12395 [Acidobacteria bacterium]|nr:MAG: hypothetical protein DMH00_12395 [Acidobacteriota bacterium]